MGNSFSKKFKARVRELVGEEYTFLEEYQKAKTKIKVRHNICKNEYKVSPDNFYRGKRCPKCFGGVRRTNQEFLTEVYKLVDEEYVFLEEYVNNITPLRVMHTTCKSIYNVSPSSFIHNKARCPQCANDRRKKALTLTENEFLDGMNRLLGNEYTFLESYKGNKEKIKVRHNVCGNIYEASPQRFQAGDRCKKCSDSRQRKTDTSFTQEVFSLVGDEYVFLEKYKSAREKMEVSHNKCGHIFSTTPNNFLRGNRCPNCFTSKGEEAISNVLESRGVTFQREVTFPDLKKDGLLRYDFGVYDKDNKLKLLIEYDGQHHFNPIEVWGGDEGFAKTLESDALKNAYATENSINLTRIPYWEFNNIERAIDNLLNSNNLL